MQCALRRADRLDRWRSAIRRSRNCGPHEIEGTPVSASQPTSRSCASMMACVSRIEGRLSNDVLCLLQRMSLFMALNDTSRFVGRRSLSGRSGSGWAVEFAASVAVATAYANRALRLSPLDPLAFSAHLALGQRGDPGGAQRGRRVTLCQRGASQSPLQHSLFHSAAALALAGRAEEARPIAEVRSPIPAKPGQLERCDCEYRRNGTANLFVFLDVHRPWRKVKVTTHRAAVDFAVCMRELAEVHLPAAERIRVVLDNLSTHIGVSLCAQACQLVEHGGD